VIELRLPFLISAIDSGEGSEIELRLSARVSMGAGNNDFDTIDQRGSTLRKAQHMKPSE
jgi:hypothetical protein